MRFRLSQVLVLAMTFVAFPGNSGVYAGIIAFSGFDRSLEGWTSNLSNEVTWKSTGGNPGGYAQFVDGSTGETWFVAPAAFRGDLRILDGTGTLTYDQRLVQIGGFNSGMVPMEVRLSGPGGEANWLSDYPTEGLQWNHMIVPFQQNAWNIMSGSWSGLLANVTSFWIRAEHVDNFWGQPNRETFTIDNVTLTANPVPEPASIVSLLIAGAAIAGYRIRRRNRNDVS